MTAAAFPAGIVPSRPAWRSLLWIVPLTASWTLLIYFQPAITASGVPSTAARLTAFSLVALGLWLAGLAGRRPIIVRMVSPDEFQHVGPRVRDSLAPMLGCKSTVK